MALSRKVAMQLCNSSEIQLFDESTPAGIKVLTDKQIQSKIKIAQKYKDKYTTLLKSQTRKVQAKSGRGAGEDISENTNRKIRIFDDCIKRFESTLEKRKEIAERPKKKRGRPVGSKNKYTAPVATKPSKKVAPKKKSKKS